MKVIGTRLPEVLVLEPAVFEDQRGFFLESYNRQVFGTAIGGSVDFVQDNHSRSSRGVLRGLHYQLPPHEQGKLVRVAQGTVFDVAVDIRRNSPRFGQWAGVELSSENRHQLWIPPGFAHGFLVLTDSADVLYKASAYYAPAADRAIRWDDPRIGITWPDIGGEYSLSGKDGAAPLLGDAALP